MPRLPSLQTGAADTEKRDESDAGYRIARVIGVRMAPRRPVTLERKENWREPWEGCCRNEKELRRKKRRRVQEGDDVEARE